MMAAHQDKQASRSVRFFGNVLWAWMGVGVNLVLIAVLSPYIVRKIGDEGYGLWTLALGLIDYYWLLDLGFRTTTLKYTAHYRALNQPEKINEVMSTSLLFSSFAAAVLMSVTLLFMHRIVGFFHVSPGLRDLFQSLVQVVGFCWSIGIVFNMFGACLEGLQRFDITNRIWIGTNALRAVGCVTLLYLGYGLFEMALMVAFSQVTGYVLSYLAVRKVFREWHFSPRLVKFAIVRQMLGYSSNTFAAIVGVRTVAQLPPTLIGHYLPPAFVGYFALPARLLQYSSDIVLRVGLVSGSHASEMHAKGDTESIYRLGIYVNRYCLTLFLPLGVVFLVYGREIISVWIRPAFAANSAPLLPILTIATAFAVAAQYNTISILYGLGKHGRYAAGLLVEAALNLGSLIFVVPRYGILGATWTICTWMVLIRGIWVPLVLCRSLGRSFQEYMRFIYARAVLTALPALALAVALKMSFLPGRNWRELFTASALVAIAHLSLAFFTCLRSEHRASVLRAIGGWCRVPVLTRFAARFEAR